MAMTRATASLQAGGADTRKARRMTALSVSGQDK